MCNDLPIAHISTGLPLKENEKVLEESKEIIWNEKGMRTAVKRALMKEPHGSTTPSMCLIEKIFTDAEKQGLKYDLRDLQQDIMIFASKSTHQASKCLKIAASINYCTIEEVEHEHIQKASNKTFKDEELYFFDVEVFPNLFLVVLKQYGKEPKSYINPTPEVVEEILSHPLVGFNNRGYDNHIMYAGLLGKSNLEIYNISKKIIEGEKSSDGKFGAAYELSYTDIYDYSSTKQSLKKWEIEMGIKYDEFEYDFN